MKLAHLDEFINRINFDPDKLVQETYELIDKNGDYNRYDPNSSTRPLIDFVTKARIHVQGTYLAAKKSLENHFCYHLGGGMHHAMSSRPGGFCMFNDIVIAIRKLQKEKMISRTAVIDLDCHKGDGAAEITKDDSSIKTFSIHMQDGWPLVMDALSESLIPSDLDVPISVDNSENYLKVLKENLDLFLKKKFDLVLVVHGVDVWEHDALPSSDGIKLSKEDILKRDTYVYQLVKEQGIPQAWCLGGGYGSGVSELYLQFLRMVANNS